jgi:hypothetical protein
VGIDVQTLVGYVLDAYKRYARNPIGIGAMWNAGHDILSEMHVMIPYIARRGAVIDKLGRQLVVGRPALRRDRGWRLRCWRG